MRTREVALSFFLVADFFLNQGTAAPWHQSRLPGFDQMHAISFDESDVVLPVIEPIPGIDDIGVTFG